MPRFRELEAGALERLRGTPSWIVVSTGGGAVLRDDARRFMRGLGLVIGLRGSVDTVARGLARTMDKRAHLDLPPREHAARVLRERRAACDDGDGSLDGDRGTVRGG